MVFMVFSCAEDHKEKLTLALETGCVVDTTQYPRQSADGKHIVYLRGSMTADKGLKVYVDTVSVLAFSEERAKTLKEAFDR